MRRLPPLESAPLWSPLFFARSDAFFLCKTARGKDRHFVGARQIKVVVSAWES